MSPGSPASGKKRKPRTGPGLILVTGFEPFGKFAANPSWESARRLDGLTVAGRLVRAVKLPVSWNRAWKTLEAAWREAEPLLTVLTGLHPAPCISIERLAHNLDDASEPDNDGERRSGVPIVSGGPVAYWSKLPVKETVKRLKDAGLAAALSGSAGFFLCNHVFYRLMGLLESRPGRIGGFIHVPPTVDLDPRNGWPADRIDLAVRIAVETAAESIGPASAQGGPSRSRRRAPGRHSGESA